VVSNENENGSNGKYPAFSPVCKASTLCPHVFMRLQKRPLLVLMFRRLCYRVRLLACFASLYSMSESH
jgi:hypothetical protein